MSSCVGNRWSILITLSALKLWSNRKDIEVLCFREKVAVLPIKTTIEDIDALGAFLKGQVGWVPLDRVKKTIDGKLSDARKLEAQKRIGLLERDGTNLKLSDRGRSYATTEDPQEKQRLMGEALREVPLYFETIEWIHHSSVSDPSKTVVGNYWHDKHQDQLEGAQGSALTDAVIFFLRLAEAAGLGKFTRGSKARPDSYLKTDSAAVASFVSAKTEIDVMPASARDAVEAQQSHHGGSHSVVPLPGASGATQGVSFQTSPAVHVNLEIHIAADATAETVAEIFKNMRKYVLSNPDDSDE